MDTNFERYWYQEFENNWLFMSSVVIVLAVHVQSVVLEVSEARQPGVNAWPWNHRFGSKTVKTSLLELGKCNATECILDEVTHHAHLTCCHQHTHCSPHLKMQGSPAALYAVGPSYRLPLSLHHDVTDEIMHTHSRSATQQMSHFRTLRGGKDTSATCWLMKGASKSSATTGNTSSSEKQPTHMKSSFKPAC